MGRTHVKDFWLREGVSLHVLFSVWATESPTKGDLVVSFMLHRVNLGISYARKLRNDSWRAVVHLDVTLSS